MPKVIEKIYTIKYIFSVEYVDGSKAIIEVDPVRLRPVIDGKMCSNCGFGESKGLEKCSYIMYREPTYQCPTLTDIGDKNVER